MKKFIYFFLFFLVSLAANSQTQPSGIPSPKSDSGFAQYNWVRALKGGIIFPERDTAFTPTYIGTVVFWRNTGVDSALWVYTRTNNRRWSKVVTLSGGVSAGTVTSIATNAATGITGGTITTSGTLVLDTTLISTRLWRQKGIDSVQYNLTSGLSLKVNISDTALMLNPYLRKIDTTAMLSNYVPISRTITTNAPLFGGGSLSANRTFGVDTGRANAQLVTGGSLTAVKDTLIDLIASSGGGTVLDVSTTDGYGIISSVATPSSTPNISLRVDTVSISTRDWRQKGIDSVQANLVAGLALKLNLSDTAAMLSNRFKISDTLSMLLPYLRKSDTLNMLSPYRRTTTKIQNSDLANSTISGISLGSNLATLTFGDYLQVGASSYNGSAATTITTNGTSTNSGSTLVARDVNGDFSARNISASLLGNASSASTVAITNDVTTNATYYPMFSTVTTGATSTRVSSSKLTYNPSTGALSATSFIGNLTGNASSATVLQTPRTINGVAFDGSADITISAAVANSLTAGYGITGSPFDGALARTWVIDTSNISTKANVTGALVAKLNIYDTAAMLAPFIQYSDTTGLFDKVVRTFGTQTIGGTKTFSGILNASSDLIFQGANNNKIEWNGEDGLIYTNGGSFLTLGSSGNASNLIFDRTNARWGVGGIPTTTFDVNGTMKATTIVKSGGTSSQILLADGSTIPTSSYGTGTVTSVATSAPITGGTITSTGTIGITQSTTSTDGYLSSTDWNTFNNKASTASVALKLNISDTAAMLANLLRKSDTLTMLSNYRRSTTLIENSDLRNSAITINGSSTSLGGSISVGTVTSVAASAGTGISVTGSPITSSGTLTITNTAPDQTVTLTAGSGISVTGTYPNFTVTNSSPSSGGTVTSVSAGIGMSFTTITSTGAVNADTTTLATRAYAVGLDVGKANTSLNNVNGVLSSTYGGAGSVSGILKANGLGVVSAAVAGTDYVAPSALSGYLPLSGGTLTGALNGTSLSMSSTGNFADALTLQDNLIFTNSLARMRIGATNFAIQKNDGSANYIILDNATGNVTLSGALNGTSLSMSGAASLATSSGSVGIGTASPAVKLDITSDDAITSLRVNTQNAGVSSVNYSEIQLSDVGVTRTYWRNMRDGSGSTLFSYSDNLRFLASGIERARISSDGTFLINTTTTDGVNKLIVNGGVKAATTMTLGNDATYGANYRTLGLTGNADGSHRIFAGTSDDLYIAAATSRGIRFWTNGTTNAALILTSTGSATFSSSINGTSLSMSGGGAFLGDITAPYLGISSSSNVLANVNTTNATGGYVTWQTNGTVIADLGTATQIFGSGGSEVFGINGRGARAIAFGTNNTERARISSDGTFLINTTTTDGVNKLIVNGGVKGNTAEFTAGITIPNGTSTFTASANAVLDVIGLRNSNSGTSAVSRFSIGNDASANAFTLKTHSSTHATLPNVAQIYNEFNANLELGGYGATALTLGSGGAATFSSSVTATNATLTNSTASTSTTTGALIVTGGVGVGGAIWAGSGFFESDQRWKKINNRIASNTSIDAIRWTWNETHKIDERQHWGYLAQDVLKVLPEAVSKTKEGFYGVEYNSVFSYKIANLEKIVSELEHKLEKLEQKLEWYSKITKK